MKTKQYQAMKEALQNQIKNKHVFLTSPDISQNRKIELSGEIKGLHEALDILEKVFI